MNELIDFLSDVFFVFERLKKRKCKSRKTKKLKARVKKLIIKKHKIVELN